MATGFYKVPKAVNEPVVQYETNSNEQVSLLAMYKKMYNQEIDVPLYIGKEEIRTGETISMHPPHDHKHTVGVYHTAQKEHIEKAIDSALEARKKWANTPWQSRAAIFLKAADLLAGPFRDKMNAATMIAQSKNVMQSEIDAVAELCDFFRFNVEFMTQIYQDQPISSE